ncbi:MAG: hypothetical protein M3391_08165 [Actinomycetota bacterium]|nr:hypothetical protein [Actinomycetota bacterium]
MQRSTWFDTEFIDEPDSCIPKDIQGLGLSARSIQGQHHQFPKPLAQGMVGDRQIQAGDDVRMSSQSKISLDPIFQGGDRELFESSDMALREGLGSEVSKRRSVHQ